MKQCTRCLENKPKTEFYVQSLNSKDGYQSHCKICELPHIKANRNANYTKRRAAKIQRTPKWLSENDLKVINGFYCIAQMLTKVNNESWHVDHIIPLQAKLVSGLHVPKNLQLIRGIENETKRNDYFIN